MTASWLVAATPTTVREPNVPHLAFMLDALNVATSPLNLLQHHAETAVSTVTL